MNVVITYQGRSYKRTVLRTVKSTRTGDKFYRPLNILMLDAPIDGRDRMVEYLSLDSGASHYFIGDFRCNVVGLREVVANV